MSALKSGLVLTDMGTNPRHNESVFYFTKDLSPRVHAFQRATHGFVHKITSLPEIKASLERGFGGYKAFGLESIGFLETPEYA